MSYLNRVSSKIRLAVFSPRAHKHNHITGELDATKQFRGTHLPWVPTEKTKSKTQARKGSIMRNRVSTFGRYSLVTIRERVSSIAAWKILRTAFSHIPGIALILLACLAFLPGRAAAQVFDDFETYALGSNLHGQGSWAGWADNPSAGALVSSAFSFSPTQSVNITGASDLVRTFSGATSGQWVFRVMQYIPSTSTGTTAIVLLNKYRVPYTTADLSWSVQIQCNMATAQINSDFGGTALPMIKDQWVEFRFEINLTANSVSEFYNGQLLTNHVWQGGIAGPGLNEIQALDLYANNAGPVYYDNVSLGMPPVIAQQPQSLTVTQGQMATFTVTAIGSPPPTYQWQFEGANISGATNAQLTIAGSELTNAGGYSVVVTNFVGSVTSQVAVLTVQIQVVAVDAQNPGYVRGQLVVKFTAAVAQQLRLAMATNAPFAQLPFPPDTQALNQQYGANGLKQAHPGVGPNNQGLENTFVLNLNLQTDVEQASAAYARAVDVIFAEPNRITHAFFTPNDTKYASQWALSASKLNASTAWGGGGTVNGSGVTVAVVDSGVDTTHCDLRDNWVNGYDYITQTVIDSTHPGVDPHGHGTHVSGIIAAAGNNSEGVIGLAFGAKIMPLRTLGVDGSGNSIDGANAIIYAVDHGAKIINNSWGVLGRSQDLEDNITSAHDKNVLVVCAAGNSTQETRNFSPANAENAMAVSATDQNDLPAGFSNFGVKTDVAAPGGTVGNSGASDPTQGILSTTPPISYLHNTKGIAIFSDGGLLPCANQFDMVLSGTSMAAPHVSALAAMIVQLHPSWSPEEVKQTIRQSAYKLGLDTLNGFDTQFGYGRIDAAAAVAANTPSPIASLTVPRNGDTVFGGSVPVDVKGEAGGVDFLDYVVQIAPGVNPTKTAFVTLSAAPVTTPTPIGGATLLPNLQANNFANGTYTLRVVTRTPTVESDDRNEILCSSGYLTSPTAHEFVSGPQVPVMGVVPGMMKHFVGNSIVAENLASYTLAWRPADTWTTTPSVPLTPTVIGPVIAGPFESPGLLFNWDLTAVPEGEIVLELTINYGTGSGAFVVKDSVTFIVDKLLKVGWPVAVNHSPGMKSPMAADLDGDGVKEIILGTAVFEPDGTVRPGWDKNPGLGRSNPAVVDVNNDGKLEVIAAVCSAYFPPGNSDPNKGGVMIYCYPPSGKANPLWSYMVQNPTTTGYGFGVPSSISVGDVDGLGLSVVFTVFFTDNGFNGQGQTVVFVLDAATGNRKYWTLVPYFSLSSVALANLDAAQDPVLEMVVTSDDSAGRQTTVLEVQGNGIVPLPGPSPVPGVIGWPQPYGSAYIDPVVADVDHDGKHEILVGNHLWHADGSPFPGWPIPNLERSTGALAPLCDDDCELEIILGKANFGLWDVLDESASLQF